MGRKGKNQITEYSLKTELMGFAGSLNRESEEE